MQNRRPEPPLSQQVPMSGVPQKRKRGPKASLACDTCRRLKAKCNQNMPCSTCITNSEECIYRSNPPIKRKRIVQASPTKPTNVVKRRSLSHGSSDQSREPMYQGDLAPIAPAPPRRQSVLFPRYDASQTFEGVSASTQPGQRVEESSGPPPSHDDTSNELTSDEETSPQGFGNTNYRTNGKEFYGPAATLAFLLELRSRARVFRRQIPSANIKTSTESRRAKSSLVNLMDGEDNETGALENGQTDGDKHAFTATPDSQPSVLSPVFLVSSSLAPTNQAIEKDCIDRYFMNLHVIYCFLDKTTFMKRCKQDVWSKGASYPPTDGGRGSTFPALYSAVVAVGALISGDDILDQNSADRQSFWDTLIKQSVAETAHPFKRSSLPRELAKMYFARAKFLLSDFFETCNLETQQTLFLLSIFCQYALKPHCCYMYHGMAARTAMAIGSANLLNIKKRPQEAIRTWWCMYYHEIEVCSLLGRDTMLNDPETYPVFLAKFGDPIPQSIAPDERDENVFFARSNTELARILKQISEVIYHTGSEVEQRPQVNRHQAALDLDNQLLKWKSNLRPVFDLNGTSLTEKETITKRKIILRLRFHSARIMIHRPFILAAASQDSTGIFSTNVETCLNAARQTIRLIYQTFMNRPFFRTWWYNITYAFNAASVILYVLVTGLHGGSTNELLPDVEMTLNIFKAMDGIRVARRCADLTNEILECAQTALQGDNKERKPAKPEKPSNRNTAAPKGEVSYFREPVVPVAQQSQPMLPPAPTSTANGLIQWDGNPEYSCEANAVNDDFFVNIMDANILDSFGANLMGFERDLAMGLDSKGREMGSSIDDISSYGNMWGF